MASPSRPPTPTSPLTLVTPADALAELAVRRLEVDGLQAGLILEVRRVLQPLGFGKDPQGWVNDAEKVLTDLNGDYRHEAKLDISENSRKILRKRGMDQLVIDLVEEVRIYEAQQQRFNKFQAMLSEGSADLTEAEKFHYQDATKTFKKTLVLYEIRLSNSRATMSTYRHIFRALDCSQSAIEALVQPFNDLQPQAQNAAALRPLLTGLMEVQDRCAQLETRSGALFAVLSGVFMVNVPLSRAGVDATLARYGPVRAAVEDLAVEQAELLAKVKGVVSRSSFPSILTVGAPGIPAAVTELRNAYEIYMQIYDAVDMMQEIHGTLDLALTRVSAQLKARLELGIPNAMVFTLF